MQRQNRYPTVRLAEIQFPALFPARCGEEKFYGRIRCVAISRRHIPAASFRARSVTVDLLANERCSDGVYTAAKVIPDESLGSKRFPAAVWARVGRPALYGRDKPELSRVIHLILPPSDVVKRISHSLSYATLRRKLIKTWNREVDYARRKKILEAPRWARDIWAFSGLQNLVPHFPRNSRVR